jgi:hypothetical protein
MKEMEEEKRKQEQLLKEEEEERLREEDQIKDKMLQDDIILRMSNALHIGAEPPSIPTRFIELWTDGKDTIISSSGGFGTVYKGVLPGINGKAQVCLTIVLLYVIFSIIIMILSNVRWFYLI